MRWLKRILLVALSLLAILSLVLIGSLAVDAMLGAGRVAGLTNVSIPVDDGTTVSAYVARPSETGEFPAVIMIHEWWGLREEIVGKADALAEEGYVVVAPDTYRGASTGWIPRALYQSIRTPQARVDQDLNAVMAWVESQPEVDGSRIGIMGFCYGGGKALRYSLTNSTLDATVVFYGTPITDPEELATLPAPVLGIFGTADQQIPVSEVNDFERALAEAGVPHQISLYEDQPHAFVGSIEEIRAGGAEGAAWEELLGFLRQTLQQPPQAFR